MRAAILEGPKKFVIRDIPKPEPQSGEVRIKVKSCGVCHSEMPVWNGEFGKFPLHIGHEVSGLIDALGEEVTGLKVGDPVTIFTDKQGYSEYLTISADNVIPLGANVKLAEALGEPIGCVVNGVNRSQIKLGDTVVLVGVGFMGLIMLQLVKLKGASRIIALDTRDSALAQAKAFGADVCLNPTTCDVKEEVARLTQDKGADVVIELTGAQPGLDLATELTSIRGTLVIFGFHVQPRTVNMFLWNWRGLDVVNAHERDPKVYVQGIKTGMKLLDAGLLDMKPMVTHRFSLGEINEAFTVASKRDNDFIKAVIIPD